MSRNALALLILLLPLGWAGCGGGQPSPPPGAPPAPPESRALGVSPPDPAFAAVHEYTKRFYEGDLAWLHDRFSPELKTSLTLDQLVALRRHVDDAFGNEVAVLAEEKQVKGAYRGFGRLARFDKSKEPIQLEWILRPDDTIAGFFVKPRPSKAP